MSARKERYTQVPGKPVYIIRTVIKLPYRIPQKTSIFPKGGFQIHWVLKILKRAPQRYKTKKQQAKQEKSRLLFHNTFFSRMIQEISVNLSHLSSYVFLNQLKAFKSHSKLAYKKCSGNCKVSKKFNKNLNSCTLHLVLKRTL